MMRLFLRRWGLAPVVLLGLAPTVVRAQDSGLPAALRLVEEGRLVEALQEARREPEERARAQAELHVLHHGGLLGEALEVGLEGLELAPPDPWLLQRCAYIALTLGAGELAVELCEELQRGFPETWETHAWMLDEALDLRTQRLLEDRALARARAVVGLGVLFSLLGFFLVARPSRS
jgi:tetratricopeptide (TPR) repeat protein